MSQKKKRGLQDSLSNIIKRQTAPVVANPHAELEDTHQQASLEEKKKRTSEILGLFKDADPAPTSKFEKPKLVIASSEHSTSAKMTEAAKMTTAAKMTEVSFIPAKEGFTNFPNFILDGLLPLIDPSAALVYLRLYRLSYGFGSETCIVGTGKLASSINMGERTVERAIHKLKTAGLIEQLGSNFGKGIKGNIYKINLPATSAKLTEDAKTTKDVKMAAVAKTTTNKDHDDHDHDLKRNHHQSAARSSETTPHENETMMIYKQLTGKDWTKGDHTAYETGQIAELDLEHLHDLMVTIHGRAEQPIGSFKFFATSIAKELAPSGEQSRTALKKKYEKLAGEIAAAYVGKNDWNISDWIHALKTKCLREGVQWNDDIANEILKL